MALQPDLLDPRDLALIAAAVGAGHFGRAATTQRWGRLRTPRCAQRDPALPNTHADRGYASSLGAWSGRTRAATERGGW